MARELHRMAGVIFEVTEDGDVEYLPAILLHTEFRDGQLADGKFCTADGSTMYYHPRPEWKTHFYIPVPFGAHDVDIEILIEWLEKEEELAKKAALTKLRKALVKVANKKVALKVPPVKKGFYPKLAEFSEANEEEGYDVDESEGPQLVLLTKGGSWLIVDDIQLNKLGRATEFWVANGEYWCSADDYPELFDVQWYIEIPPFMYEDSWKVKFRWAQDAKKEQDREEAERRSAPREQRGGKRDKPDNANRAVRGKPVADPTDSRRIYRRKTLEDYL